MVADSIEGLVCGECGHSSVTHTLICKHCGSKVLNKRKLSGRGVVRSFTILNVPSESFASEAPYAYVVVALAEGCGVSGYMPGVKSADEIAVGDEVAYAGRRGTALVFARK